MYQSYNVIQHMKMWGGERRVFDQGNAKTDGSIYGSFCVDCSSSVILVCDVETATKLAFLWQTIIKLPKHILPQFKIARQNGLSIDSICLFIKKN